MSLWPVNDPVWRGLVELWQVTVCGFRVVGHWGAPV